VSLTTRAMLDKCKQVDPCRWSRFYVSTGYALWTPLCFTVSRCLLMSRASMDSSAGWASPSHMHHITAVFCSVVY